MQTIETTAVVTPEHTVTLTLPADVPPGEHVVSLTIRPQPAAVDQTVGLFADWPPHENTFVNPHETFRREDLYGDDGR